jgi:hypothetical protein
MKFTIECYFNDGYSVVLWFGRTTYRGTHLYSRYRDAVRAARKLGAEPKEEA